MKREDLELLKKIGLRDFEERDLLIDLINRLEKRRIEVNKYKQDKRKENNFYGRSKQEIKYRKECKKRKEKKAKNNEI